MDSKIFKKNQNGYTLSELLIYIAIFSIVSFGLVVFLANTINAKVAIDTQNDFIKQSRVAFDTIYKEVRESYDYELKEGPSQITLVKDPAAASPLGENIIYLENGIIYIKRGLDAPAALTQSTAKVEELVFEDYTSTRSDDLIKIKLKMTNLDKVKNKYAQNEFRISTAINVRNVED